jgi:hypothetical protein
VGRRAHASSTMDRADQVREAVPSGDAGDLGLLRPSGGPTSGALIGSLRRGVSRRSTRYSHPGGQQEGGIRRRLCWAALRGGPSRVGLGREHHAGRGSRRDAVLVGHPCGGGRAPSGAVGGGEALRQVLAVGAEAQAFLQGADGPVQLARGDVGITERREQIDAGEGQPDGHPAPPV